MKPISILFLCIQNSARSQMAEGFLKKIGESRFLVESAGSEPGMLNPLAVKVMGEIGVDISGSRPKSVMEFIRENRHFDYVITVCDECKSGRCPFYPSFTVNLHWEFPDPSGFTGTDEEKLEKTRQVRNQIMKKIVEWMESVFDQERKRMNGAFLAIPG